MDSQAPPDGTAVVIANRAAAAVDIVRSLGRVGVNTVVASEYDRPPAFASKYCDEQVRLPDPETDLLAYRDALLELAARPSVRTIAPVREEDVYVLSKYRASFADHVTPLWPTFETLSNAHDRLSLIAAAERAGVDTPETQLLTDVESWDDPRIVKGRYGIVADRYVDDVPPEEFWTMPKTQYVEPGEPPDTTDLVDRMGHVPIAQEYVDGTEYCLRALYDQGEPVISTQKALRRGYKYPRGPSIYHEAVDIPELREAGLALLDELDWHGLASVGFIREASTGRFKLLEINPRFWSSLPCDTHAGVDYARHYWWLAAGEPDPPSPDYRPGSASHLLRGEAVHLHSVATDRFPFVDRPPLGRTALSILTSLVTQPQFDLLDSDDPKPFLSDAWETARQLR